VSVDFAVAVASSKQPRSSHLLRTFLGLYSPSFFAILLLVNLNAQRSAACLLCEPLDRVKRHESTKRADLRVVCLLLEVMMRPRRTRSNSCLWRRCKFRVILCGTHQWRPIFSFASGVPERSDSAQCAYHTTKAREWGRRKHAGCAAI